jgi:Flp pilus assembly protein TadG
MAMLLPVLALIIAIGLDFARAYQVASIVTNSARVAAEFGATHGAVIPVDSVIADKARTELGTTLAAVSTIGVAWQDEGNGVSPGPCDTVQVTVRTVFDPITPLTRSFWPAGQQICRETALRRNGPKASGCGGTSITPIGGTC